MNRHHQMMAARVLKRANTRTRAEKRAEKRKVREMPRPDATRHSKDDRPPVVYSPQSSFPSGPGKLPRGAAEYFQDGPQTTIQDRL